MIYRVDTTKEHINEVLEYAKNNEYSFNTINYYGDDVVITIEGSEYPDICLNDTSIEEYN